MSREFAARRGRFDLSTPPSEGSRSRRTVRLRWHAVGLSGLFSLLTACGGGVGAGESQPTVLEAPPAKESPSEAAVEEQAEEDSGDSPDASERETDGAEPIPASSDGPAENWPKPDIPEEIYEPTEEGAEALIQYWFEARHHARITGDVEPWRFASHEECDVCQVMIKRVEEIYPSGWYVGDHDELGELHVGLQGDRAATGLLTLHQASFKSYWQGELYGETPTDQEGAFALRLSFADQRWQASELTVLKEQENSDSGRRGLDAD